MSININVRARADIIWIEMVCSSYFDSICSKALYLFNEYELINSYVRVFSVCLKPKN